MISATALRKTYGDKRGIEDVSFTAVRGETVAFLGPNGAGKTTLMNILSGCLAPSSGRVEIAGEDMMASPLSSRKRVGYLPETPPLYGDMTVSEYLRFVCGLRRVKKKDIGARVSELCAACSLEDVKDRLIGNLSLGYRQRAGLAQALAGYPDVIILDEPTAGLDPRQTAEFRSLIRELGRERVILFSTHILSEAEAVCGRVLVINEGRIAADAATDDLRGQPSGLLLRAEGGVARARGIAQTVPGVISATEEDCPEDGVCGLRISFEPGRDIRRALFFAFSEAGVPILMLRPSSETLEEVFMRITSGQRPENGEREGSADETGI